MLGKSRDKYFTEWKTNNKSLMLATIFFNFPPRLLSEGAGSTQLTYTSTQRAIHSFVNFCWQRVRFSFLFNIGFSFLNFSVLFFLSFFFSLLWFFAALCPVAQRKIHVEEEHLPIAQAICKCVKSPCFTFWIGRGFTKYSLLLYLRVYDSIFQLKSLPGDDSFVKQKFISTLFLWRFLFLAAN